MTILGEEALTLKRFAAGSRGADGRWTDGAESTSTIYGSVQPTSGDDLVTLLEGERAKRGRKVYTETEVLTADVEAGTSADQIEIDGEWFEARTVSQERSVIAHYKVILLALQETES